MSGYEAAALVLFAAALVFVPGMWRELDRVRKQRDHFIIKSARHLDRALKAERERDDAHKVLTVVLDAHARDIVLDPLGTDLWPEVEPLRVVDGGQR